MKKIIATLLIFGSLLSLAACSVKNAEGENNESNLQGNLAIQIGGFDYLNEDLTKYVEVPKSVYESYEVILEAKADEENTPEVQTEEEEGGVIVIDKENVTTATKDDTTDKIMEQFYAQAIEKVTFKALPEAAVTKAYSSIVSARNTEFKNLKETEYASVDEYAAAYYGVSEGEDWNDKAMAEAEYEVKCKLIIFSIARAENFKPTDEEKSAIMKELGVNVFINNGSGKLESLDKFTYVDGAFSYTDTFVGTDGNIVYTPGTNEGNYEVVYNPNLNIQIGTGGTTADGTVINTTNTVYFSTNLVSVDQMVLEHYTVKYVVSNAKIIYA